MPYRVIVELIDKRKPTLVERLFPFRILDMTVERLDMSKVSWAINNPDATQVGVNMFNEPVKQGPVN